MYDVSKMNPFINYIQKTHLLCDTCIVCIDIAKLQNAFSLCIFFKLKFMFRYHFLGHFLAELIEICCGSLLNSIVKTYRRKFLKTL